MVRREVHTRGVVVARRAAGEGSVRVLLHTEALGLVKAMVKSAREERSKLRPYLVPGTRGSYSLVKGKVEWRVTGVLRGRTSYFECGRFDQRASAERVLLIVWQFVHGEGADPMLFAALYEFLEVLPTLEEHEVQIAEYVAVLRILAALGYVAKTESVEEFVSAEFTAALLTRAEARRRDLVALINRGLGASGL